MRMKMRTDGFRFDTAWTQNRRSAKLVYVGYKPKPHLQFIPSNQKLGHLFPLSQSTDTLLRILIVQQVGNSLA
jgi:hypothetical protein